MDAPVRGLAVGLIPPLAPPPAFTGANEDRPEIPSNVTCPEFAPGARCGPQAVSEAAAMVMIKLDLDKNIERAMFMNPP